VRAVAIPIASFRAAAAQFIRLLFKPALIGVVDFLSAGPSTDASEMKVSEYPASIEVQQAEKRISLPPDPPTFGVGADAPVRHVRVSWPNPHPRIPPRPRTGQRSAVERIEDK